MPRKKASSKPRKKNRSIIPSVVHEGQVSSLINLAARLTSKAARIRLGHFGAWPGQIPLLLWIAEQNGIIQRELVERATMEQSSVAEHLERMEREGLIRRARGADDKRKYRIYLTEKGRAMSHQIVDHMDSGARAYTAGISQSDLQVFDRVIRQIILQLNEYCRSQGNIVRVSARRRGKGEQSALLSAPGPESGPWRGKYIGTD